MPKDLDNISLAHACWNCKYHIVLAPSDRSNLYSAKIRRYNVNQVERTTKIFIVNDKFSPWIPFVATIMPSNINIRKNY